MIHLRDSSIILNSMHMHLTASVKCISIVLIYLISREFTLNSVEEMVTADHTAESFLGKQLVVTKPHVLNFD